MEHRLSAYVKPRIVARSTFPVARCVKNMDIIKEIKKNNLVGRGGACYPVADKWDAVARALGDCREEMAAAYVVCNVSEGEPGVKKDGYILENFTDETIEGIKLAMDFLEGARAGAEIKGYIYINHNYQKKLGKKIEAAIRNIGADISIFIKPIGAGYIGGEETSLLNALEGKRVEPRLRPPFPTQKGFRQRPTIVNNVETFLNVSRTFRNTYGHTRFYSLGGDILWSGVYELSDALTIAQILRETNNYPKFNFFAQIGGDGSGTVLSQEQLEIPATGAGSITIYSLIKHQPMDMIRKWLDFFMAESCGQCVPCREGVYRLRELLDGGDPGKVDWPLFADLLANLSDSAFCGLGCAVPIPIESYVRNVLSALPGNKFQLPEKQRKMICECFS